MRHALIPGVTELDLWSATQTAMEQSAGSRLTVVADVISGPRTAHVSGDPTRRKIHEYEPVICDLLPQHRGYWGDSTSTLVCDPAPELSAAFEIVEPFGQVVGLPRPCSYDT